QTFPATLRFLTAIGSGMSAADAVAAAIAGGRAGDRLDLAVAPEIKGELHAVRNVKPLWSGHGTRHGVLLGGLDLWSQALLRWSPFGTLRHRRADREGLLPLAEASPIVYPPPDGVTTFDRGSSVFLAAIAHDEDQPVHLRLADRRLPIDENLPRYGEPAPLYCPAGVYEVAE